MKLRIGFVLTIAVFISCNSKTGSDASTSTINSVEGTWKLVTGILVEKGVTTVTDYTKNTSFIKIINKTHFAFLQHDLKKGKDTASVFVAGGGPYSLSDSMYTEHLEYCSDRVWEGNDFSFKIEMKGDTLIQKGIEKVESAGVNRVNIEKYIRVKK